MEFKKWVSILVSVLLIATFIPLVTAESQPVIDMPTSIEEGIPFDVTVRATSGTQEINSISLYYQERWWTNACLDDFHDCIYTYKDRVENRGNTVVTYQAKVSYKNGPELVNSVKLEIEQSLNLDLTYPSTVYVGKEFTISVDAQDNIGIDRIEVTTPEGKLPPHIGIMNPKTLSKDYTFSYDKEGTYTYYIVATDIDWVTGKPGLTDFEFISVRVIKEPDNHPPVAVLDAAPRSGTAPLNVEFDVSSSTDEDNNIISYELDFGDGSDSVTVEGSGIDMSSEEEITHEYENPRTAPYLVTLTIIDEKDSTSMASVSIAVNAEDTTDDEEEEDDDTDVTPGGGGGGGRGDGGSPYRVSYPIEEGYATLSISEDHLELDAGDSFRIAVKVRGESGDYSLGVDADFGEIDVPEERYIYDRSTFYIEGEVDEDAEGKYVMKVNLLRNGEIVDTERVYVTIDGGFGVLEILGIIFLTLIALSGVGLLVYMLIRRGKGGQIDLRKYY